MSNAKNIKSELISRCLDLVEQRIANAQQAMNAAQESANTEGKSSAGDKYETGRAMAQIERDKAAQQLNEARILKSVLTRIDNHPSGSQVVMLGSVVKTDNNHFFLAISLGKIQVDGADYFVIAPATPIGRILMGLKAGRQFSFNNQLHTIREIL
jgi:transcription elongation GreA/GreB family factor